jgi:hypothetical protein
MDFIFKYQRILLEIYPSDELGSTSQNLNENSEFVEIVKSIVDENDKLVGCDLNLFLEKITVILNRYVDDLKQHIIDLHGQNVWDEFYNYYILSQSFKYKDFFKKYPVNNTYTEIVGKIVSIESVVAYINSNITNKNNKTVSILEIGM